MLQQKLIFLNSASTSECESVLFLENVSQIICSYIYRTLTRHAREIDVLISFEI